MADARPGPAGGQREPEEDTALGSRHQALRRSRHADPAHHDQPPGLFTLAWRTTRENRSGLRSMLDSKRRPVQAQALQHRPQPLVLHGQLLDLPELHLRPPRTLLSTPTGADPYQRATPSQERGHEFAHGVGSGAQTTCEEGGREG